MTPVQAAYEEAIAKRNSNATANQYKAGFSVL